MRVNRYQYRAIYSALVIVAFFIPAYHHVSAFEFLFLAIGSIGIDSEITLVDLFVVLLPLLLIPAAALWILVKTIVRKPLNSVLLGLPFFSILFFFLILWFDRSRQVSSGNPLTMLTQMRVGFYLAAVASLLLLFSYSRRESLNLGPGKR